jgi:hypothetical protein
MLSERVSAAMESSAARVCAWCERVGHEDDRVLFLRIQQGHNGAPVYATQMHGTPYSNLPNDGVGFTTIATLSPRPSNGLSNYFASFLSQESCRVYEFQE